jgi:hypothetical protein
VRQQWENLRTYWNNQRTNRLHEDTYRNFKGADRENKRSFSRHDDTDDKNKNPNWSTDENAGPDHRDCKSN